MNRFTFNPIVWIMAWRMRGCLTMRSFLLFVLAVSLSGCIGYNYARVYYTAPLKVEVSCKVSKANFI